MKLRSGVSTPWSTLRVAWCLVAWNEALVSTFSRAFGLRHVTVHEKSTRVSLIQGATYEEKERWSSNKTIASILTIVKVLPLNIAMVLVLCQLTTWSNLKYIFTGEAINFILYGLSKIRL